MSDPYNPYQSHGQVIQPESPSQWTRDEISKLNVSESWKRKFRLVEKAGGPELPDFRALPFGERFGLSFNIIAFFLGPFYYLAKGLWRQAVLYLIAAIALIFVFDAMGWDRATRSIGYGFAAVYAMRANISYYKSAVLGQAPWL